MIISIYGSPLHKLQENEFYPSIRVRHEDAIKNPRVKKLFNYFGGGHKVPGHMWQELLFNASSRVLNSHPVHDRINDPYHHEMKYHISNLLHKRDKEKKRRLKPGHVNIHTLRRNLKKKSENEYKNFNDKKNKENTNKKNKENTNKKNKEFDDNKNENN